MKVVTIVQARMGSTRLPGKLMAKILGKPMLWHIINRLKESTLTDEIIVATTTKKRDDEIENAAKDVSFFRGSEDDVLDRYYKAAKKHSADVIVRVTGDCPFVDPQLLDKLVNFFLSDNLDYLSNTLVRSYPKGIDLEIFTLVCLEKAWKEAKSKSDREHVTPYIHGHPDMFKIRNIKNKEDFSSMRWTVDYKEDMEFTRIIYKKLFKEGEIFYMSDIINLLKKNPEIANINRHIK